MKGSKFWNDLFQFNHQNIEAKVIEKEGSYKDLHPEALYTSFEDLELIFQLLPSFGTWVDLGAGVGQSALMYGTLFPEYNAIAVEFDSSRIEAGLVVQKKLKLTNVEFLNRDLLTDEIPEGDIYFLYFPTGKVLDRILKTLSERIRDFHIVAIESHGDLIARLLKEQYLNVISNIPLTSSRHLPHAYVFKATELKRGDSTYAHDLSFEDKILCISENESQWLGDSNGLLWSKEDVYDLLNPPRSINWNNVQSVHCIEDFSPEIQFSLEVRRLGSVKIQLREVVLEGFIRKIYFKPCFILEISSGQKVEWSQIQTISWGNNLCYDASSHYYSLPHVLTKL